MSKSIKLKNDTYWDASSVDYNHTDLETTIGNIINVNNTQNTNITNLTTNLNTLSSTVSNISSRTPSDKYVSGDTVKTSTVGTATFTGSYQGAYLIGVVLSCGSSSAEDTGLVIFKARSNESSSSISYGVEKTNSANASITQSGSTVYFKVSQTVQWRYLRFITLAKSDNVTI